MLGNSIADWFVEYWLDVAVCIVFVYFLINKSTRKIAFKVLCGILLMLFIITVVPLICIWIFGADNGFAIGWVIPFHILLLPCCLFEIYELQRIIRLKRNGIHTHGTLVRRSLSSRSSSVVEYSTDGRKYKCYSHSPLRKYENDCNEIPVVYDEKKPENSCIEKQDFLYTLILFITFAVLELGMIILTVYFCNMIFS